MQLVLQTSSADLCNLPFSTVSVRLSLNLPTKMSSADCGGWRESTRAAACKEGGGGGLVGGDGRRCLDSRQTPQQSLDGWLTAQQSPASRGRGKTLPNLNPLSLSDYSNFPSFPTFPPLPLTYPYLLQRSILTADTAGWNVQIGYWRGCEICAMLPSSEPSEGTQKRLHSIMKLDASFSDEHMFESNSWADIF